MSANTNVYAMFACLVAAALWGLLWYPLRLLNDMGVSGLWASLGIYMTALLAMLPLYFRKRSSLKISTAYWVLIAIASGWTNLAYILAMLEGKVVRVLLLFFLSPVWTLLLGRLFLQERISARAYLNLFLAFFGVLIILYEGALSLSLTKADLLALSSGFAFAATNVIVRKIGDIPMVLKMVPNWTGVIFLALVCLSLTDMNIPSLNAEIAIRAIILMAGVGLFGMILMTYLAQYGATHLPVHQSATLFLFEVPVGVVSAAILSTEIMSASEWLGGSLVMLAAWLSIRYQQKNSD